ncbi:MAG: hypothetical protein WBH86_06625 [Thermogutta sp.]
MATLPNTSAKESIFARLDKLNEFERQPVSPEKLHSGRYFAGLFAGEHVAATEFVIGALFVIWGAKAHDILVGLLLGNALAVLSWTLICAPIAVQSRLTLYWYLRQIGGPVLTVVYNLLNAVLYCILAGCMITVAASAVRIPFGIPPQTGVLPTDPGFVVVVIIVGAVVVTLAILGFKRLSQFAVVCSPWMLSMFVCGALIALPSVGHVRNWETFLAVANERIWTGTGPKVVNVSQQGRALVLELGPIQGHLRVLSEQQVVRGADPLPIGVTVPGFFLSEETDGKAASFVPAEARLEPIYAETPAAPKTAINWKNLTFVSFLENASNENGKVGQQASSLAERESAAGESQPSVGEANQERPQQQTRSQRRRGSRASQEGGEQPEESSTALPMPATPAISGWRIIVESPQVTSPQSVKYVMPKKRAGVICDENFVPLQSFQASITDGPRAMRSPIGFWHIVFFAWICNLAMHLGLSDMAIFRFAKRSWYGLYSAFGMFLGHYIAWICAGIMGAAAARLTMTPLMQLDSGQVAYLILGWAGVVAVVIAGWTTSNPTLYRAGLALQILTPNWPRWVVTLLAGTITTIIACSPFVFIYLLDFVGIYGILLMPVGAIVVVEHWVFPLLGWRRFWATYRGQWLNIPAILAWGVGLGLALVCWKFQWLHLFFLVIPVWFATALTYLILAGLGGAARKTEGETSPTTPSSDSAGRESTPASTFAGEKKNLDPGTDTPGRRPLLMYAFGFAAMVCLLGSYAFAWFVFAGYSTAEDVKPTLLYLALAYFVSGVIYLSLRERRTATSAA